MIRVLASMLLLTVAACASPPPRVAATGWYADGQRHAPHHRAPHHRTTRHRRSRHVARHLPPVTFRQQTRRRCDDGDDGACRMLRAMGGG